MNKTRVILSSGRIVTTLEYDDHFFVTYGKNGAAGIAVSGPFTCSDERFSGIIGRTKTILH